MKAQAWLRHTFRTLLRQDRGQVIVLAAGAMVVLLGFAALAIDVGFFARTKGDLQNDADAMALAGVQDIADHALADSKAREWGTKNHVDPSEIVSITFGAPTCRTPAPSGQLITVRLQRTQPTFLARVLGITSGTVTACATARLNNAAHSPYALFAHGAGSGGCGSNGDITMSGGGNTVNGAVQADGTLTISGSSTDRPSSITGTTGYGCTISTDDHTTITPPPVHQTLDWPAYYTTSNFLPCTFGSLSGPDIDLDAATYRDPLNPLKLKSGVYCANQKITGTLIGISGTVTLVTTSSTGEINISGGNTNLSPFLSNHVLAFSSSTDSNRAAVLSGGGSQWNGIIVAQFGGVTISGGRNAAGQAAGISGAIMAKGKITISGGASTINAAYLGASDLSTGLVE